MRIPASELVSKAVQDLDELLSCGNAAVALQMATVKKIFEEDESFAVMETKEQALLACGFYLGLMASEEKPADPNNLADVCVELREAVDG